jgi:CubicO group peptidase (beta-lactamase class C family)
MLLTGAVSPQRARALANTSQIDQRIQTWIDRGYYRGAGLLIAKDGRVLYERYFGTYTPDTVVFIASAGKWLAAATIMTLVDEGTLSLDDPASKCLPMLQGPKAVPPSARCCRTRPAIVRINRKANRLTPIKP